MSLFYNISKILNKSVTQVHYIFEKDEKYEVAGGNYQPAQFDLSESQDGGSLQASQQSEGSSHQSQTGSTPRKVTDFQDQANLKKKERLRAFVKQDVMVGSQVQPGKQKKISAAKMSNTDSNWQFSSKMYS